MLYKLDKTIISSGTFEDSALESKINLKNKTPIERFEILEFLRSQTYGESGVAPRLQKTIEVVYNKKR